MSWWRGALAHGAVAVGFGGLAAAWSYPLVLHLSTHLPGGGIGDNAIFLWNFWWMREALASGAGFFHTTYLFAPVGADLTLHTHTALPALVGATLLGRLSVVTALNVTTLASLALNGFAAYLLAWRIVRHRGAAILAGVAFGTSPYIAAHLNGHFNLTTAWTVPLFALCIAEAVRGGIRWAVLAGVVLAATAYIDYYYLVFEVAFACATALSSAREWRVTLRARPPSARWALGLVGAAIAIDFALVVVILATGGFGGRLGSVRFSARDAFNPLQALWALIAIALWLRFGPRLDIRPREGWSLSRAAAAGGVVVSVFLLLAAPLVWNGFLLAVRGQYVTHHYTWRSAPNGIDLLTLFLGDPFHGLWGGAVRHLYARFGIDAIESGAWLGLAPLLLAAYAMRRRSGDPVVRQWVVTGLLFFVWALGSHVLVAGRNTGMIAPEVLLRYVPFAANARMPGRAIVIVDLAVAVLAAAGAASLKWRRPALALGGLTALVLADFFVAPFPVAAVECPQIYQVLRDRPERGALVELPLGVADGFGDVTPFDRRELVYQTVHHRPLVGGFLARRPPGILAAYRADPLVAVWLRLSGARADVVPGGDPPDAARAAQRMKEDGIAFVMLNRRAASPRLREYVEQVLPVALVAEDGDLALYRLLPPGDAPAR